MYDENNKNIEEAKVHDLIPFVGFKNMGNTCYLNSILQVLYHCPQLKIEILKSIEIVEALEEERDEKISKDNLLPTGENAKNLQLMKELNKLFCDVEENQKQLVREADSLTLDDEQVKHLSAIPPESIITNLRNVYPAFEPNSQQDAQECFNCILTICKSAISHINGNTLNGRVNGKEKASINKMLGGRKLHFPEVLGSSENKKHLLKNPHENSIKKEVEKVSVMPNKTERRSLKRKLRNNFKATENTVKTEKSAVFLSKTRSSSSTGCFEKIKRKCKFQIKAPPIKNSENECYSGKSGSNNLCDTKETKFGKENNSEDAGDVSSDCKTPPAKRSRWGSLKISSYKPASAPFNIFLPKKKHNDLSDIDDCCDKSLSKMETIETQSDFNDIPMENISLSTGEHCQVSIKPKIPRLQSNVGSMHNSNGTKRYNFIEEMFQGEVVSTTRCVECESEVNRYEKFQDVSLPVKETQTVCSNQSGKLLKDECQEVTEDLSNKFLDLCTLKWALSEFTATETMDGENKYFCDTCLRLSEGERKMQFSRLPPIFALHLKRFSTTIDMSLNYATTVSKITSALEIPKCLKFSEWCCSDCHEKEILYELFGIVVHSGTTITGGHYLSYIKYSFEGASSAYSELSKYDGRWIEFDDNHVRLMSSEEMNKALQYGDFEVSSRSPYMLFYHRIDSAC